MMPYYARKHPVLIRAFNIVFFVMCLKCFDDNKAMQLAVIVSGTILFLCNNLKKFIQSEKLYQERKRMDTSDIYRIDGLDGFAFERYLSVHFRKLGYKVIVTPPSGDYGVDLVLMKGNDRIAVQAKRYKREVSYQAIQEVVAGKAVYNCNKAMVVTNSTFTEAGRKLAQKNGVILWDRTDLINHFQLTDAPRPEQYHPRYQKI